MHGFGEGSTILLLVLTETFELSTMLAVLLYANLRGCSVKATALRYAPNAEPSPLPPARLPAGRLVWSLGMRCHEAGPVA